jgi:hypothetical protein
MKMSETLKKIEGQKNATVADLATEIDIIKNNHLAHMAQDIDELKDDIKDNRKFFTERMDRLDTRIWWIMGLTVTTLLVPLLERML